MIQDCIKTIILNNGRNSKTQSGLLPPYFDINFMVECMVGLNGVRNDVDFKLGSYYLKSFIEILVRLEDREFISSWWKEISFMHFNEFVPDKQIDYYRLHCQTGTNMTTVPKKEKRWKELNEEQIWFSQNLYLLLSRNFLK
jgi:hypothetical protein